MVYYCVVPGCKNLSNTPGVLMHPFPKNSFLRSAWIASIPGHAVKKIDGDKSLRVCSNHFSQDNYIRKSKRKVTLNKWAIPKVFLRDLELTDAVDESSFDETVNTNGSSSLGDLPDLVLMQIFSYLNCKDLCQVALVCHRWHDISKSAAVWKKVTAKIKTPYHLLKFLFLLPFGVVRLRISCSSYDIHHPLYLPDILYRLHERCPHIKSLIFENVFFSQRLCNSTLTTANVGENENCDSKSERICKFNGVENCLPDLTLISLRYSRSFMSHLSSQLSDFFPNLKILDLTFSTCLKDTVIPFFCKLPHLEELYLVQCPITNSGLENLLKHMKRLKVLDLEGSPAVDDQTFEILQCHGKSLEKLYLGNTGVRTFNISETDIPFPQLKVICLKNIPINQCFIANLQLLPSLQGLIANTSLNPRQFTKTMRYDSFETHYSSTAEGDLCICHHFKIKYLCEYDRHEVFDSKSFACNNIGTICRYFTESV